MTTSDAGKRVIRVWESLLEPKLDEDSPFSCHELLEDFGMMCRSCFSAFDRLSKLQTSIDSNLDNLMAKVLLVNTGRRKRLRLTQVKVFMMIF